MRNSYPISAPRAALTAILTTSVLLACTPAQQAGQTQNCEGSLILPERDAAMTKHAAEVKTQAVNGLLADDDLLLGSVTSALEPEAWLEKIRLLLNEGKFDDAGKELDRFRAAYPGEDIDQSLIRQLETAH